jgi:hypothetical protein
MAGQEPHSKSHAIMMDGRAATIMSRARMLQPTGRAVLNDVILIGACRRMIYSRPDPRNASVTEAFDFLHKVVQIVDANPKSEFSWTLFEDAAVRYLRALEQEQDDRLPAPIPTGSAAALASKEASPAEMNDLVKAAILLGVATVAGAAGGAAGAALVKEVLSKEIIKGAVAGFMATVASMAAERVIASNLSSDRQTNRPSRDRDTAPQRRVLPDRSQRRREASDPPARRVVPQRNPPPSRGAGRQQSPPNADR